MKNAHRALLALVLAASLALQAADATPAAAPAPAPVLTANAAIDDDAFYDTMKREAVRMLKDDKFTPFKKLRNQLKKALEKSSRVALPAPAAPGAELKGWDDVHDRSAQGVLILGTINQLPTDTEPTVAASTAFVLSADGLCATNYHIFEPEDGNKGLVVCTRLGKVYPVVEILAASHTDDVAIFRVDTGGEKLTPLPLGELPRTGAEVAVLSHPTDHYFTFTVGRVSRFAKVTNEDGSATDMLHITADFAAGSSGGPVLNAQGQVVGMVASTESLYYEDDGDVQKDLQMVVKTCVSILSIRKLLDPK